MKKFSESKEGLFKSAGRKSKLTKLHHDTEKFFEQSFDQQMEQLRKFISTTKKMKILKMLFSKASKFMMKQLEDITKHVLISLN